MSMTFCIFKRVLKKKHYKTNDMTISKHEFHFMDFRLKMNFNEICCEIISEIWENYRGGGT